MKEIDIWLTNTAQKSTLQQLKMDKLLPKKKTTDLLDLAAVVVLAK